MAEGFDDDEWDASDLRVGRAMYLITVAAMLAVCTGLAWAGYARSPLLGWPCLGGVAFVLLRVWKRMLRGTLAGLEAYLDKRDTVFEPPTAHLETAEQVAAAPKREIGTGFAIAGLALYAVLITLFWYGMGWGVRALAELF